jgi:hypothetical protein
MLSAIRRAAIASLRRFVAVLRQHVDNDWRRTLHDIRWDAGVPASWFRGRNPELATEVFEHLWCLGGVLATVNADPHTGARTMAFNLTV